MTDASLADVIHNLAFGVFWLLLFTGAVSTIGRVVYYRRHGFERPRLLVRDSIMILGFSLSFGLVLFSRAAGLSTYLIQFPAWAVLTDVPAIVAVLAYVYFELFVIERPRSPRGPGSDSV